MDFVSLSSLPSRIITDHASEGFTIATVLTGEGHVAVARVAAGGCIGRHPAPSPQLLVLVSGSAEIVGDADIPRQLRGGEAVVWWPGEEHGLVASEDCTVLIVEGELRVGNS